MSNKLNLGNGILMVICTMFGYGVITMPMSFLCLYWPYSLIFFIGISLIMCLSLYFLCISAYKLNEDDYYNVCKSVHPYLGYYIDGSIFLLGIICCSMYSISIFNFLNSVLKFKNQLILKILIFLILSVGPFMKDLKKLQFLSYVSVLSVFLLGFILFYYLIILGSSSVNENNRDFGKCSSNIFFSLCCHQGVLGVYGNLKVKSSRNILILIISAILSCFFIYGFIGIVGAFLLGDDFKNYDNVIISLNSVEFLSKLNGNNYLTLIALFLFSIMLSSSFSFQFHPARASLISFLSVFMQKNKLESEFMRMILTSIMLLIIFIIYLISPNLDFLGKLINAFAVIGITIILPSVSYFNIRKKYDFMKILSLIFIISGISMSIYFSFKLFY